MRSRSNEEEKMEKKEEEKRNKKKKWENMYTIYLCVRCALENLSSKHIDISK